MIHTDEDDEFARIEREAELRKGQPYHFTKRKDDDDDIQDYVRPWVGLTDEEIWETVSRIGTSDSDVNPYAKLADARAIEAKLKEKNT